MNFRTIIPISASANRIEHRQQLMMFGSCFTENIGERLHNAKFKVDVNPFGIQYNPFSLAYSLDRLVENKPFTADELFEAHGLWHSFAHHSKFSAASKHDTLEKINRRLADSAKMLHKADFLFLTFGTAWVYELKETGAVVSNCHKLADKLFVRRRLSVAEIVEKYSQLLAKLKSINPKLQVIFTVSPIRHWKDGAHENNVSKSVLLLAIEELQAKFDCVNYFPAYELQLDELRDYRFYTEDMLHPNATAINYIWDRFGESFFSAETKQTAVEMDKLRKALAHRPFNKEGADYKLFCEQNLNKIKKFELAYPEISFEEEKALFFTGTPYDDSERDFID